MSQQRYIYPPSTIEGAEALYSFPNLGDGFTTISQELLRRDLSSDRSILDKIDLPLKSKQLELAPNELATSNSIFNIIDGINENFLYLNTRTSLVSNVLPGNYRGYYTNDSSIPGLPIFRENTINTTAYVPPTAVDTNSGSVAIDTTTPNISSTTGGESLNDLVDGVWIRDNTSITRDYVSAANENWHYGFLANKNRLTVVKMSSKPIDQSAPVYNENGQMEGSQGWLVMNSYENVEELPSETNQLTYNNITMVKSSKTKKLYILDRGVPRTGVTNISTSSQRSVIYRYDVSGYLNREIENHVQYDKRLLVNTLGDLNTMSNESDIVDPVAFTVKANDTMIVYDEHDYTFKEFDTDNNFLSKHPKRNILFRGAPGANKQYVGVKDIHYDTDVQQLYILTPTGGIMILDNNYKLVTSIHIPKDTSNQSVNISNKDLDLTFYKTDQSGDQKHEQFLGIEFSENEANIYYVITTHRIIKRFKSRSDLNVGVFNLLDVGVGMLTQPVTNQAYRALPKFMSVLQEANVQVKQFTNDAGEVVYQVDTERSYSYDQIYVYTDFVDTRKNLTKQPPAGMNEHYILSFNEKINIRSNLSDSDYSIYNLSDTSSLSFKEYNSDYVYNKLFYKMLSNHLWLINKINYKLTSRYTPTGVLVFDKREYITEREYRSLLIDLEDPGYYVGTNEYFTTAVLNRCFKKIVDIQVALTKVLNTKVNNTWPSQNLNVPVEPYLHTDGSEFMDIDDKPYSGYYFVYEQPSGDIVVSGRDETDGTVMSDGSPSSDRFLTTLET